MHVRIAKLPEVCVIRVDYMIIGHCKNSTARQTERTVWRQQVRAYLKFQEWDNPNIPCGDRYGPLQDDDQFGPNDVIEPDLPTGGYPAG
eukprot:9852808-Heterocapsa_arctica.AAC.1